MQLISKFNKGFRFLLCAIDIFSKYARVVPLKDKKGVSIVNAFQKILNRSEREPKKIWADKGSEFYNIYFKRWLKDNDIKMYSIHNGGKSVVAERFIRTLKNKIYKYMTSVYKNVYIKKSINNNTYHKTIKMKTVDVEIIHILILKKKLMIEMVKLVIMLEFLNTKIFLQKDIHQIDLKKFLLLEN